MVVDILMEIAKVKPIKSFGMTLGEEGVANPLSNHRPVLTLHQGVVVALSGPVFGKADPEFFQQWSAVFAGCRV